MIRMLVSSVVFTPYQANTWNAQYKVEYSWLTSSLTISVLSPSCYFLTLPRIVSTCLSQSTERLGNHDSKNCMFKATGNKACHILSSNTLKGGHGYCLLQNSSKEVVFFFFFLVTAINHDRRTQIGGEGRWFLLQPASNLHYHAGHK